MLGECPVARLVVFSSSIMPAIRLLLRDLRGISPDFVIRVRTLGRLRGRTPALLARRIALALRGLGWAVCRLWPGAILRRPRLPLLNVRVR